MTLNTFFKAAPILKVDVIDGGAQVGVDKVGVSMDWPIVVHLRLLDAVHTHCLLVDVVRRLVHPSGGCVEEFTLVLGQLLLDIDVDFLHFVEGFTLKQVSLCLKLCERLLECLLLHLILGYGYHSLDTHNLGLDFPHMSIHTIRKNGLVICPLALACVVVCKVGNF